MPNIGKIYPVRHIGVAVLVSMLPPGAAMADQFDTWNLVAGATVTHDGNLFRLPDDVDPRSVTGKSRRSDNITVTSLGIRFDKSVSLQRFQFDCTASNYRHETYGYLDFTGTGYSGTWNWALTPHLHGTLSARRSEALAGFADYRSYSGRNVQRTEYRRFDAEWAVHGPWRLVAAVTRDEAANSQVFQQYSDSRSIGYEGGTRFVAASGNWISLVGRRADGQYLKRTLIPFSSIPAPLNPQHDTGFTSREEELRVHWAPTGKSTLDGRISRVSRVHDHFGQRNYSGYVGQLDYTWGAAGKFKLGFSARQLLSPWQDAASSYYVGRIFTFTPVWQLSPKTDLRLQLSQEEREYKGAILPTPAQRQDTLRSGVVAVNWTPVNSLVLSVSVQREERASNVANYDFKDTIFNLSGQLMF